MPRPVDFCHIVHGQDYRHSAQAGVRHFDMTLEDVLGGDAIISKEAIGGFVTQIGVGLRLEIAPHVTTAFAKHI
jgi:hypothetical protein